MLRKILNNQKGMAIISVYVASAFIAALSASAFSRAYWERRHVDNEVTNLRSFAAAEAGLQRALSQISQNAYTGFINTAAISESGFSDVYGNVIGGYNVTVLYPDQADWVILQSTATIDGQTRNLEGRVFLESNLSKYLVYADTGTFSSGNNAQYGASNGTDPQGVPSNDKDRTMMYFTGSWNLSGSNVHLYGDAMSENTIYGSSDSQIHGDSYASAFSQNGNNVSNDGVSGSLVVNDGFDDDIDRNGDGVVNSSDYKDKHDLTADGDGDSKAVDSLVDMDLSFYAANNNTPSFSSGSSHTRYLQFEAVPGTSYTRVVEYDSSSYQNVVSTQNLPSTAIVYVKGDAWVRGEIQGRVSIASSDDIMLTGDITYANGQTYADAGNSTAFLAKDKLYFMADDMSTSGILYAENTSHDSTAFDAGYNTNGQYDPYGKEKLRLYGNRVIKGSTNLSYYGDRVYGYDPKLKYFRPPGIPVVPELRTVREI